MGAINHYSSDLLMSYISIIINVLLIFLFWARNRGNSKLEHSAGLILIILAVPIFTIDLINYISGREWWTYILPLPMVVFLIIELFFDYIYTLDFRKTKLMIVYLIFYYPGLFGLIGYAFLTDKALGYISLGAYFINQMMTFVSHKK
jgi:hypothetical protein